MLHSLPWGTLPDCHRSAVSSRAGGVDHRLEHPELGQILFRALGPHNAPAIVVLGGISADRRMDEWWPEVAGRSGALNPEHFRLLSIDWLGASSRDAEFPSTSDQADAICGVLDHVGVDRLEMLVGASYGAMVGLAFACRHGDRLRRLVAISGAHRSTVHSSALRLLQRRIVRAFTVRGETSQGVALARAIALTGYRPSALFERRFNASQPAEVLRQLDSYFDFNGWRFAREFDAGRYLALSESIDHHNVDPGAIDCPVDTVSVDSDTLVPPQQMRAMVAAIGCHARLHQLSSPFGHDAFLKSPRPLNRLLSQILEQNQGGLR